MRENGPPFVALIIVVLAALAAALLLVVALLVWLAELMGSILYPALLLSLFFALLAFIIYKVSLRGAISEIRERLDIIYEVAKVIREGVAWVKRLIMPSN